LQKTGGVSDYLINFKENNRKDPGKDELLEIFQSTPVEKRQVTDKNVEAIKNFEESETYVNVFDKDMQNTILDTLMKGIFDMFIYASYY
jgi:hypothetical protein